MDSTAKLGVSSDARAFQGKSCYVRVKSLPRSEEIPDPEEHRLAVIRLQAASGRRKPPTLQSVLLDEPQVKQNYCSSSSKEKERTVAICQCHCRDR